jgi:hypothetical protein
MLDGLYPRRVPFGLPGRRNALAFELDGQTIEIAEVLRRWRARPSPVVSTYYAEMNKLAAGMFRRR